MPPQLAAPAYGRCAMLKPAWLLMVALLLQGCSELLFYPEPGLPLTPHAADLEYRDVQLRAADGTQLHGWWLPAKPGVIVKGTVLHLHGNGGNLAWHLGGSYWLPEQGYQVLMLDYRGYGLSRGEPDLPAVYGDIEAAFVWLQQAPETHGKPLVVLGQSLGGALAVHYLASHPLQRERVQALVLDGVPANYRQVARNLLGSAWLTWPLQVPLSWMVPEAESAQYAMPQLAGLPVLIFQSIDDQVVPMASGIELYKVTPPPRVLQLTRGAHVETFSQPTWREVMLLYLQDPAGFSGLRRLAETPDKPAVTP